MSILFGIWQAEGRDVDERQLIELSHATRRFAPDGTFVLASGRIGMGFQPYHTHQRSNIESQPTFDKCNNMIAFDGRLDNHEELRQLLDVHDKHAPDSLIVLTSFHRWGEECFSKFIGDWALALWSHEHRSLYLARDHAGTKTLHYEQREGHIVWSTYLETFLPESRVHALDESYVACYLSCQPIRNLTPYRGIKAVPPAHYLVFREDTLSSHSHWEWTVKENIVHQSDAEYEEHFLSLFRQSVERRTGPGAPILAHLSGGMDSTSIVCMSDEIRARNGASPDSLLDTVSYYDESEPNWDERPYFSAVEKNRGKSGIHISTSFQGRTFALPKLPQGAAPCLPGQDNFTLEQETVFQHSIDGRGYRAIISGIGGDEVLGGVPDPLPELADFLTSFHIHRLLSRGMEFCLLDRTPLIYMLAKTIQNTFNSYCPIDPDTLPIPPWIHPRLKYLVGHLAKEESSNQKRIGLRPGSINNGQMWWRMLETLPHRIPAALSRYEYRYPYLDRDLVDYLFRIPREQLVRPGRRRSLMRRSLRNIVPSEVLERRRKAFLIRGPLVSLQREHLSIHRLFDTSLAGALGLIDTGCLKTSLAEINKGSASKWWPAIVRAITFELWLQGNGVSIDNIPFEPPSGKLLRRKPGADKIRTDRVAV